MRKADSVAAAAAEPSSASLRDDGAPVKLVCLALILSVVVLGCRIASIW
jgi:hypothetical protein